MDSQSAGPIEKVLRATIKKTASLTTALGLVLIIGFLVAGTTAWLFTELAETVQSGGTLHPSDVLGGAIIGAAWAIFCMTALESEHRLRRYYWPIRVGEQ